VGLGVSQLPVKDGEKGVVEQIWKYMNIDDLDEFIQSNDIKRICLKRESTTFIQQDRK
jgi:hypothetical protein